MMSMGGFAEPLNAADAAINRVLEAERRAQDEILTCRRDALAVLSAARARARVLAKRSDRRITLLHSLSDKSLSGALAALRDQARALSTSPELTTELSVRLDAALDRLVDELTCTRS